MEQEEMEDWMQTAKFVLEGVAILIVSIFGVMGSLLSYSILVSRKVQKNFHNLLMLLNTFDLVEKNSFLVNHN